MAVHPQMQGHGLGRKLATKLERFVFRKLGLERVFLSTGSFMVGAPAFYKSLGYEEQRTEIFPGYTPERVFLQIVHFVKIKSLKVRL
jgi:ribosomal protein S18 acetylase RimI-like enzyme